MRFDIQQVAAADALPLFSALYGADGPEFAAVIAQLAPVWQVGDGERLLGVLGLRPATAHGSELMGGASAGGSQVEVATRLLLAARPHQPKLYAYAEDHLLPALALEQAGFTSVSAYTRMSGPLPTLEPRVPAGFTLRPLAEISDTRVRFAAQETYADQIGHTPTSQEAVEPGAGGSEESLGWLAFDADGLPVGVLRVWRDGETVSLSTPGVHSAHRATGLRRTLILAACQSAREAGASSLVMEAWGDTEQQRQDDLNLGLSLDVLTPIYATGS